MCVRCKKQIVDKPKWSYVSIVAAPFLFMVFVLDPWLWGGPVGRHVKFFKTIDQTVQFAIVLAVTVILAAWLANKFLALNTSNE